MNLQSKELFINMRERDIPFWNPMFPFEEQDKDVRQFWQAETVKLLDGVTINGVFIHPWLYWHINFWKMMSDVGVNTRVPITPDLRDNEWFFAENLARAERENKGMFMFGTRRFGKALLDSEVLYMEDREVKIGDVLVGDRIYGDDGRLAEVTGVYPQGRVMTYRVTFEDGRNVVCSGDHLWRVRMPGVNGWSVKPLRDIMKMDFPSMRIPLCAPVAYGTAKLPLSPSAYGSLLASHLGGYEDDIPLGGYMARKFLRSSPEQKRAFLDAFIKAFKGVVTGHDELEIRGGSRDALRFVLRMAWSSGMYAKAEGNKLVLSTMMEDVGISSIDVYGKYNATCITVDNEKSLFLTTNYVVTHNSAIMASFLARNATMTYNLTHNVIGGSAEDLSSLSQYLEFGFDNVPPFLKIGRTSNNWSKGVVLGVRTVTNERDIHATIQITNLEGGKASASLKPAGGTPYTSIYDEVGKFSFLDAYLAGLPAHMYNDRMRGMIIAAGCLTAGNEVMTANGERKMIEDVEPEDGIMGFDVESGALVGEKILWLKPPSKKRCCRLRVKVGERERTLGCSWDHPIYCLNPCGRDFVHKGYVNALFLNEGDVVGCVDGDGRFIEGAVLSVTDIGMADVYNLSAGGEHNYVANGIITHNTGGNVEKSQDAQKVMNNPSAYGFIVMDYDLLNRHAPSPTWRTAKSAIFVPGQMSYAYSKDETTLDKYLGLDGKKGLSRINIKVTNFERATAQIKGDLEALARGDKKLYAQRKMAYPLTVDDCFLSTKVNRFPVEDALIHKSRLLESGRPGKAVDIYQMDGKRLGWTFSEKPLAPFPFEGGNFDAPVVIYEDPPEEGGVFDYTYVSSLDIYKSDKADTTSLGSFYVYKRMVGINDPFGNRIVASYASRPASSDDFCRTCEVLQEAYGAMCLMENADRMYEMYLHRRNKEMILLEDGEKLANRIIRPGTKQNNRLGLSPTVPNQRMLYNAVLQYCWEDVIVGFDEDGNEITQKGIYRIDDVELLEEIIAFGPGVNTDRIISFGHSLLLAKYYDDCNYWPESPTQKANRKFREEHRRREMFVNGISVRKRRIFK